MGRVGCEAERGRNIPKGGFQFGKFRFRCVAQYVGLKPLFDEIEIQATYLTQIFTLPDRFNKIRFTVLKFDDSGRLWLKSI